MMEHNQDRYKFEQARIRGEIDTFRKKVKASPRDPRLLYELGKLLLGQMDPDSDVEGLKFVEKAVRLDKAFGEAHELLCWPGNISYRRPQPRYSSF